MEEDKAEELSPRLDGEGGNCKIAPVQVVAFQRDPRYCQCACIDPRYCVPFCFG